MGEVQAHTGRGGAGNTSSKAPPVDEESFHTPTLKQPHYTTGRGGSGNIVSNDSAENARLAQDVTMPASVAKDPATIHHTGRGGGGNVAGPNGEQRADSKDRAKSKERSGGSLIDKAKELVGGKK